MDDDRFESRVGVSSAEHMFVENRGFKNIPIFLRKKALLNDSIQRFQKRLRRKKT